MATLKQYAETDLGNCLSKFQSLTCARGDESAEVVVRLLMDFTACCQFIAFYVPSCSFTVDLCHHVIGDFQRALDLRSGTIISSGFTAERMTTDGELVFTHRAFLYVEAALADEERLGLEEQARGLGLSLVIRDHRYRDERNKLEKPLGFVCHDSRDKEDIANPLAVALLGMRCPVWYDEFSLKVGDGLRGSVEKGLKECKRCILIITKNFLSNDGWTKREFDSIFTRELIERSNVILPVWREVSSEDVYQSSPSLADRLAVKWELGADEVARRLAAAMLRASSRG
jgi:hypothetical protein